MEVWGSLQLGIPLGHIQVFRNIIHILHSVLYPILHRMSEYQDLQSGLSIPPSPGPNIP